jgi:hypothetical protein
MEAEATTVSHALDGTERRRGRRLAVSSFGLLALVLLGPLSVALVMFAIPEAFDVEWACVGPTGVTSREGDVYADLTAVAGAFGWIVVLIGVLFAQIAERPLVARLLPIAWFGALVGGAAVAAALIGPAPCPA